MSIDTTNLSDGQTLRLPVSLIDPLNCGGNVRRKRNPEKFKELTESIKRKGVIQSVTLRPSTVEEGRFELLAGYGRVKACKEASIESVPAIIKIVNDVEAMEIMLDENFAREDLGIVDEIHASKRYVALYDGDYSEASKRLGWTEKKLKGRLALSKLASETLDALDADQIKLGHAEILSQFTHKTQVKTLPKIINEGWTVDTLKKRALSVQKKLSHARFDTGECQSCEHNSEVQSSLFDNNVGGGRCGNSVCWNEKTKNWLDNKKLELESEYGTILFLSEKSEGRNTVAEDIVGSDQFSGGCTGCASNIIILNDDVGKEGDVIENQCIDNSCFTKCVNKLESIKKKAKSAKQSEPNGSKTPKANNTQSESKAKKGKASSQNTPKAVLECHQKEVRPIVVDMLLQKEHFKRCLEVGALIAMAGIQFKHKLVNSHKAETAVSELIKLSEEDVESIRQEAIEFIAKSTKGDSVGQTNYHTFDRMCAQSASAFDDIKLNAVTNWKPTEENIGKYLKGGIKQLLVSAKFDIAFNSSGGVEKAKSFDKLMGMKKDEIIKVVLSFPFNWDSFAPKDFISLME